MMGYVTQEPIGTIPPRFLTESFIIPKPFRQYLSSYYLRKYNGETLTHVIHQSVTTTRFPTQFIFLDTSHQEVIQSPTEEFWVSFRHELNAQYEIALVSKNYRPVRAGTGIKES